MVAILTQELSDLTGGALTPTMAGYILGGILVFFLFLAIELIFTAGRNNKSNGTGSAGFFFSAGLGIVISVGLGWFETWTIIFIGLIIAFVVIAPLGSRTGGT